MRAFATGIGLETGTESVRGNVTTIRELSRVDGLDQRVPPSFQLGDRHVARLSLDSQVADDSACGTGSESGLSIEAKVVVRDVALSNRLAVVGNGSCTGETDGFTLGIVTGDHLLVHVDEKFALTVFDAPVKMKSVSTDHSESFETLHTNGWGSEGRGYHR